MTELDRRGFEVASGSACTSSTLEPSHVLAAMGALTHGNVRVSVGRDTTDDDVERFLAVLPAACSTPEGAAVTLELDCRGLVCPAPVIELARRIDGRRDRRARRGRGHRRGRPVRRTGVVPDDRPGVRRRGDRRRRRAALRRTPGQAEAPRRTWAATSSAAVVAVGRADPLDELLGGEGVLLGADRLDDVRRQHAADLRRPLVPELPLEPGQEAGPEGVTDPGRLDGRDAGGRLDLDRLAVAARGSGRRRRRAWSPACRPGRGPRRPTSRSWTRSSPTRTRWRTGRSRRRSGRGSARPR